MSHKLETKLLQQNCWVSDTLPKSDLKSKAKKKTYYELHNDETQDGITVSLHEVPYPIDEQSVKSYVDSCNYKQDPFNAVRPAGQNLGDISQVSEVLHHDTAHIREVYQHIYNTVLKEAKEQLTKKKTEVKKEDE